MNKVRNLVAKDSKNKSGAGPHKSDKDYNRYDKEYIIDVVSYIDLTEQIAVLEAQQAAGVNLIELTSIKTKIKDLQDKLKEL